MSTSKLSLKVVMNKGKSKVLFAEADSYVVDCLMSFLTLPLGTIARIQKQRDGVFGSLTALYTGLSNLDSQHFSVGGAKQMLLNPATSFQHECRRLKLDVSETQPRKVYHCEDPMNCRNSLACNVSMYPDIAKCACGRPLNREVIVTEQPVTDGDDEVFMVKGVSFLISDDLRIEPVESDFLHTLSKLGITDTVGAEMSVLSIGFDDIVDLLNYSLVSATPLTDLVIKETAKSSTVAKPDPLSLVHGPGDYGAGKMVLKVFLQKSTNKFLLAVATEEFMELLFSFLAVPLGGVEYLLKGNTHLKNVDNLYESVKYRIHEKYFRSPKAKERLMNPKLTHGYVTKNQFLLSLTEQNAYKLFLKYESLELSFKSSQGEGSFVKKGTKYILGDDLTITPFSVTSSISIPNSLGICLSDVTVKDLHIGTEEALSILKASLSSATPLSDVLVKPMPNELSIRSNLDPGEEPLRGSWLSLTLRSSEMWVDGNENEDEQAGGVI